MKPHFDEKNKCFELDSCLGFAKVCLVYKDIASGIVVFFIIFAALSFMNRLLLVWPASVRSNVIPLNTRSPVIVATTVAAL